MIEKFGNIWDSLSKPDNIVVVTTNNNTKMGGLAVMGKGIALECQQLFPDSARILGDYIIKNGRGDYYFIPIIPDKVFALQTKRNWYDPSPLDLIIQSLSYLEKFALSRPDLTINLPRPGCGNGQRNWLTEIKPLCETLPDNCVVWGIL